MSLAPVLHPAFRIVMNGRDVTADLSKKLLSVSYTDYEEGQADTIDIRLEDVDGKLRGPWFPEQGYTLNLKFGYEGTPLREAGEFEIDEIQAEGPPDVVAIRAIAAGVKTSYRTHKAKAYDDVTLHALAQRIARRLRLQLVGNIEPIPLRRVTQVYEKDLEFLRRVAGEYGYAFSVKGSRMVFFKRGELYGEDAIFTLRRGDLSRYQLRDKIMDVPKSAEVSYHDPKTKRLVRHKVENTDRNTSGDKIKLNVRVENSQQAKAKAMAAIEEANADATTMNLSFFGNPKAVAGINFRLEDMGRFDGVWHIVMSRHDMDRSGGYRTEIEAKRIRSK